jgi:hypothetical protein
MKYDDASWHYGGDFPQDLAPEAGGTHIGIFVTWAMLNGLAGPIHTEDFPEELSRLKNREFTPGAWFLVTCDEKFTDEDLNDEGNDFARSYYADEDGLKVTSPNFLTDYEATFPEVAHLYRIPDTWETYDKFAPTISRRFIKWRNTGRGWRRFVPGLG